MPMRLLLAAPLRLEPWTPLRRCSCVLAARSLRLPSSFGPSDRALASTYAAHEKLDLVALDRKWQQKWEAASEARAASPARVDGHDQARKAYVLPMFPYPSGALHMGHLRVYTITDVLARYKRMQGFNVLHPVGWDAFGLPAENAAIERAIHPADWTLQNIATMKEQLRAMNGDIDWSREFMSCDPAFYKHTQRLFLLLHERGLAYQAEALVNYDPVDRTVLANEQVDSNGFSWRSGAKVEKINLKQWFLRITHFKEALLEDLDFLSEDGKWTERVVAMQRHWLGRSEGATVVFPISAPGAPEQYAKVFTTRPDTLFGVQYLALSASHPLVAHCASRSPDLAAFLDDLPWLGADSKAGFQLPGVFARNPLADITGSRAEVQEPLPVFVAPYVVDGYGAGAVMGVPGHDTRDFAFWQENRADSPIRYVIQAEPASAAPGGTNGPQCGALTAPGYLTSVCEPFQGLSSKDASDRIVSELAKIGDLAEKTSTWRLRDWLISRQRYWGTPIPIVHCGDCGAVPVPFEQLPVELPRVGGSWLRQHTGNPLEAVEEWVNVACPRCGVPAKRDTDTMDTFMCSSWYMFRYLDPNNASQPFAPEKANAMMPVDVYVGGIEHAILHLLYARFIAKFLATTDLWPAGADPSIRGEPFRRLISQGMVHGKTYSDPLTGRFLRPDELDLTSDPANPRIINGGGVTPAVSFEKMSKSKYNGVDPLSVIGRWGADVTRAHILFQAPVTEVLEWDEEKIVGIQRWYHRIWRLVEQTADLVASDEASRHANKISKSSSQELLGTKESLDEALRSTTASINTALSSTYSLNTCISDLMQLTNAITTYATTKSSNNAASPSLSIDPDLLNQATRTLLLLLAPFAPAFASECWERLQLRSQKPTSDKTASAAQADDIFSHPFPTISDESLQQNEKKATRQRCTVMQNGRVRFTLDIRSPPPNLEGNEIERFLLREIETSEVGARWLAEKAAERRGRRGGSSGKSEDDGWNRIVVVRGGKMVNFVD